MAIDSSRSLRRLISSAQGLNRRSQQKRFTEAEAKKLVSTARRGMAKDAFSQAERAELIRSLFFANGRAQVTAKAFGVALDALKANRR